MYNHMHKMNIKKTQNIKKGFELIKSPCTKNDFHCVSNPSVCIPKEMVCDDIFDCSDHSDEADCYLRRRKKDEESMAPQNLIGLFLFMQVSWHLRKKKIVIQNVICLDNI